MAAEAGYLGTPFIWFSHFYEKVTIRGTYAAGRHGLETRSFEHRAVS